MYIDNKGKIRKTTPSFSLKVIKTYCGNSTADSLFISFKIILL